MILDIIKTEQYKPLKHGGIKEIQINVNSPVVCLIGQNGSGKSTLLKEMSPYPSTSTDFDRDGLTYLEITHKGDKYKISSDFALKSGAHSFIKNDVQLNESGTTGTQTQLCELHLEFSPLIRNIMFGDIQISSMSKSDRKKLLLSCYPNDLSFILKHHKSICSKIRAVKSNLKLMNVKKLEIKDKMIGELEFKDIIKLSDDINDFRVSIDKWIHSLTIERDDWKQHEFYQSRLGLDNTINHNILKTELESLHNKHIINRISNREIYSGVTSSKLELVSSELSHVSSDIERIGSQVNGLISEIEEFEKITGINSDNEIKELNNDLTELSNQLEDFNKDLSVISEQDINNFPIGKLEEGMKFISNFSNEIYSREKYNTTKTNIQDYKSKLVYLQIELKRLKEIEERLNSRYSREVDAGYNPECVLVCQLKSNYNTVVDDLKKEIEIAFESRDQCEKEIVSVTNELSNITISMEGQEDIIKIVDFMEKVISHFSWFKEALRNNELINVLNNNPIDVFSNTIKIINNSEIIISNDRINSKINDIRFKLTSLTNNKQPTKEFIINTLENKKTELLKVSDAYISVKNKKDSLKEKHKQYQNLYDDKVTINSINESFVSKANYQLIKGKMDLLDYIIESLSKYRCGADEKQAEIKNTVKEQKEFRTNLDNIIIPTISELNIRLVKLDKLESALSPNSGFPHVYMVRFINSLILAANEFIRIVWSYDMELIPLEEENVLDFSLGVRLSKSTKVKDVSVCSKGQQEIINLSWTLALCNEMGIGKKYPLILDEPDSALSNGHRENLLTLLNTLIRQGNIKQLILVNHFNSLFTAFAHSQIVCLAEDGIVTPTCANIDVEIKRIA